MKTTKLIGLIVFCCFWLLFTFGAIAADPIKIAAVFSKTGVAAEETGYYETIALAVEQINQQGGILGRPVEIIELDNKSTALGSKQAALEAVKRNVTAVIGAAWSSHSLAMAPVLQKTGIPMITPVSTNPKVTPIGDYIFRVCFTDPFQGKVMAQFARSDLKAQTAVILTNINSDYSMGLSKFFKENFAQSGAKILWEGKYREKDIDFANVLEKVKTLKPDVTFLPGHDRDSALLMKHARAMNIETVFLGGDGWSTRMYDLGGKAVEGGYASTYWHPNVPFPKAQQIQKDYYRKYGEKIRNDLPLSYDAVMVLADAMVRAKSLDPKKIRKALAATMAFEGSTGTITFDKNGDPLNKDAVVMKFDKGTTMFVKSIKP